MRDNYLANLSQLAIKKRMQHKVFSHETKKSYPKSSTGT